VEVEPEANTTPYGQRNIISRYKEFLKPVSLLEFEKRTLTFVPVFEFSVNQI
jgi:hypothetical protein